MALTEEEIKRLDELVEQIGNESANFIYADAQLFTVGDGIVYRYLDKLSDKLSRMIEEYKELRRRQLLGEIFE
jgi:hypothetical protein